jgi:uncharacterized protein YhaN
MRFEELILEKYGVFESRRIALPGSAGLVVIHGPNEAGKSTCLAAISDFLFGIPSDSEHGQIFGYPQMRITARVLTADGTSKLFRRRKGRGQTITDLNDQPVDEGVLLAHLGATTRERFSSLFGLDHASLRKGGERLLAADGDIGRLIVEAGGGLRHLISEVDELKIRGQKLFSTRRYNDRAFYKAFDSYVAAENEMKSQLLTREVFEQTRTQYETAKLNLARLRNDRLTVTKEVSQQDRLIRVLPILLELEAIENRFSEYNDLGGLAEDFDSKVGDAFRLNAIAKSAFEEAVEICARLEDQIASINVPFWLLDAESKIRDIIQNSITVAKARTDRRNREIELEKANSKLKRLRQIIGVGESVDLRNLLPEPSAIGNLQALLKPGVELPSKVTGLELQIKENQTTLASLESLQTARLRKDQDRPVGIDISELSQLGSQCAALEVKRRRAEELKATIGNRLKQANFATIEELQAFVCPDPSVILDEIQNRAGLEGKLREYVDALTASIDHQNTSKAEIIGLRTTSSVPTVDAIKSVRKERTEYWDEIRGIYLSDAEDVWLRFPIEIRKSNALKFEDAVENSDTLADRRYSEAERVAKLEFAERQLEMAISASAAAEMSKDNAEARLAHAERKWNQDWEQAVEREASLGRLRVLVEHRLETLGLVKSMRQLISEIEQDEANITPKMEILCSAESRFGLTAVGHSSISSRVQNAVREIRAHDDVYEDYRHDAQTVLTLSGQLERLQKSLNENRVALKSWKKEWQSALISLGVSEDVSTDKGNEIATSWAGAEGVISEREITIQRFVRMDEDEKELEKLINEVRLLSDFTLPEDLVAASRLLNEKLADASKTSSERASLVPQLERATREKDRKQTEFAAAADKLLQLCKQANCAIEELPGIANRCRERTSLVERQRNRIDTLSSFDDGYSRADLNSQCGGRDIDKVKGDLKQLEDQMNDLNRDNDAAVIEHEQCKKAYDQYEELKGVNSAVADREGAAAEMSRILKEYVEVSLAEEILSASIGKIRDEQQDPLISRAGELFVLATRGNFAGIGTDIDDKGLPIVVGKRVSGEKVEKVTVNTMSDGTRDQLFLAFRLSSVEHYCDSAEPLPFIGDDLLVHFDDERSAAALGLLAELGKKTQVLLFTHHSRIAEFAEPLVKAGLASIIEIADPALVG